MLKLSQKSRSYIRKNAACHSFEIKSIKYGLTIKLQVELLLLKPLNSNIVIRINCANRR